ncbi:hypothetical protein PR048_021301 [Dryococelus australis]|uniref:Uncharacterized protein n=1 Tax=Dryococelus australis TaxID=614101 RepID=A0ABQ9GXX0_9NEOP|nr:hypothetical protein PR048_021301 [Dryococelus australis]
MQREDGGIKMWEGGRKRASRMSPPPPPPTTNFFVQVRKWKNGARRNYFPYVANFPWLFVSSNASYFLCDDVCKSLQWVNHVSHSTFLPSGRTKSVSAIACVNKYKSHYFYGKLEEKKKTRLKKNIQNKSHKEMLQTFQVRAEKKRQATLQGMSEH